MAARSNCSRRNWMRPSQKRASASRGCPLLNSRNSAKAASAVSKSFCMARPSAKLYCSSGSASGSTSGFGGAGPTAAEPSVTEAVSPLLATVWGDASMVLSSGCAARLARSVDCAAPEAALSLPSSCLLSSLSLICQTTSPVSASRLIAT